MITLASHSHCQILSAAHPETTTVLQDPPNQTVSMPQAQPELKKVRSTLFHQHKRRAHREIRRTRQHDEKRDGKATKEDKWTDPRLQYLDKRLFVQLNGSRKVLGVLRGYDVGYLLCFGAKLRIG